MFRAERTNKLGYLLKRLICRREPSQVGQWPISFEVEDGCPARVFRQCLRRGDDHAWRSDRILGFWAERIIDDPERCITTTELREAFNHWLKANGQQPLAC